MDSKPIRPSHPANIHLALATTESLAEQVYLARFFHDTLAEAISGDTDVSAVAPIPSVRAYSDWWQVWETESRVARDEQRPIRLVLWHSFRDEEAEGVPLPFCLEDNVLAQIQSIYREAPEGLKPPADLSKLLRALNQTPIIVRLEDILFTIVLSCTPAGCVPEAPWFRLIAQSDRSDRAYWRRDQEVGTLGEEPITTDALRGDSEVNSEPLSLLRYAEMAIATGAPALEPTEGDACNECSTWGYTCPNMIWDLPPPCRTVATLGPNFLDDSAETTILRDLSFVLVDIREPRRSRAERGIRRHGGSVTASVVPATTHILHFGVFYGPYPGREIEEAEEINWYPEDDPRGLGDRRYIRVVYPGFLFESIRHRELAFWEDFDVYTTITQDTYRFTPHPSTVTEWDEW